MTWVTRAVVFGSFFLVPLFLQQFRGDSAVHTGLILMAQGIGSIVGIQVAARLFFRFHGASAASAKKLAEQIAEVGTARAAGAAALLPAKIKAAEIEIDVIAAGILTASSASTLRRRKVLRSLTP